MLSNWSGSLGINYYHHTCYGTKSINSLSDGIYIWKLKLINPRVRELNIAISNADKKYIEEDIYFKETKAIYGWSAS